MTIFPARTAAPRPVELAPHSAPAEMRRAAALWARELDRDRSADLIYVPRYTERTMPRRPLLCRLGYHQEHVGTTARGGYVRFMSCRRSGCSWTAIRKGWS